MKTWAMGIGALLVLAILAGAGFGLYRAGHKTGVAEGAATQQAADQKVLDARVADEQARAAKVQAALVQQQASTAKLNTDLTQVRSDLSQAQQDLAHAKFTNARSTAPVAGACPGSALGSDDFVRLWNGAAQGNAVRPAGQGSPSGPAG